ncbi:MAG TPA: hypothetical protein DEA28_01395 [Firmicutes bacterium]|nr:hypothetical protein [Bacillota bacterium]
MENFLDKSRDEALNENKITNPVTFTSKIYVKVFLYFGLALLISALTAFGFSSLFYNLLLSDINVETLIIGYYISLIISVVGMFVCSFIVNLYCNKKGKGLIIPYLLYSVFIGVLLSSFTVYLGSPYIFGTALGLTSLIFFGTCLIGALLGDKIKVGYLALVFVLFGIGVICLFNLVLLPLVFTGSQTILSTYGALIWGLEFLFLIVIILYIAIDMNRLKRVALNNGNMIQTNLALYFALNLFTDFINLFIRILRIVAIFAGNKKK